MNDSQAILSLLLFSFLIFAGFILRRIVKVYSVDGNEYLHFLGFRLLRTCPFGFCVRISQSMLKRSYTDKFCLLCKEDILGSDYDVYLIVKTKEGCYSAAFGKLSSFSIPMGEWGI